MQTVTTRCPHCQSNNRLPSERINADPTCGRCKKSLLTGGPIEGTPVNLATLLQVNKPVIIDFWAPWCGPCKSFAPIFSDVAKQHDSVIFIKVDTESHQQLGAQYKIRSIPTLMVFKNGKMVDSLNGALPQSQFEAWLVQAISK